MPQIRNKIQKMIRMSIGWRIEKLILHKTGRASEDTSGEFVPVEHDIPLPRLRNVFHLEVAPTPSPPQPLHLKKAQMVEARKKEPARARKVKGC